MWLACLLCVCALYYPWKRFIADSLFCFALAVTELVVPDFRVTFGEPYVPTCPQRLLARVHSRPPTAWCFCMAPTQLLSFHDTVRPLPPLVAAQPLLPPFPLTSRGTRSLAAGRTRWMHTNASKPLVQATSTSCWVVCGACTLLRTDGEGGSAEDSALAV